MPEDGVILVDKPAGLTSHDVVAQIRRRLGGPRRGEGRLRVGHAGTLDPFATGLLLVLIGRATRIQRFVMALEKRYVTVARFGARSSTGDRDGEITPTGVVPVGALGLPTGTVTQRPPAYSAVKVGGQRAYALARAGVAVELPEREVTVHEFSELWRDGDRRAFAIRCSSGTYVRSLVADLGDAYCEELRRTAIGPFSVDDADPERIVPLADALSFLPSVELDAEAAARAAHGVAVTPIAADGGGDRGHGPPDAAAAVRLIGPDGLVAIATPAGDGTFKPTVGLRG